MEKVLIDEEIIYNARRFSKPCLDENYIKRVSVFIITSLILYVYPVVKKGFNEETPSVFHVAKVCIIYGLIFVLCSKIAVPFKSTIFFFVRFVCMVVVCVAEYFSQLVSLFLCAYIAAILTERLTKFGT